MTTPPKPTPVPPSVEQQKRMLSDKVAAVLRHGKLERSVAYGLQSWKEHALDRPESPDSPRPMAAKDLAFPAGDLDRLLADHRAFPDRATVAEIIRALERQHGFSSLPLPKPPEVTPETERRLALLKAKARAIAAAGFEAMTGAGQGDQLIEAADRLEQSVRSGRVGQSVQTLWDCCEEYQETLLRQLPHADRPDEAAKVAAIRAQLVRDFGRSTLKGKTTEDLAREILKRGRVKSQSEADRMHEYLTEDAVRQDEALRIARLVGDWERQHALPAA